MHSQSNRHCKTLSSRTKDKIRSIRFRGAGCAVPVEIFLTGGIEINLELEMAALPCMPPLPPIGPVANGLSQP